MPREKRLNESTHKQRGTGSLQINLRGLRSATTVRKFSLFPFQMMNKEFAMNTNTIEQLRQLFFSDIPCVRIDESYTDSQYETDLLEADLPKLRKIFALGQESFRKFETDVEEFLKG